MEIVREDLVRSIPFEHQKTRKIKWTAPSEEEKNTDEGVVIIEEEGQYEKTDQIATEEEREMINMVQEFEAMMIEEEDAGDLDAKD